MDICMLTPSERAELQKLLAEYNQARVKLETFLLQIEKEWQKEVLSEPTEKGTSEEDDRIYEATERLENIVQWATVFRDREVQVTDFEDDEYTC